MPLSADIRALTAPQKAELFFMLRDDVELANYLISDTKMYEELARRDKAFAAGKIQLTTRQQLTTRLKIRRNGL